MAIRPLFDWNSLFRMEGNLVRAIKEHRQPLPRRVLDELFQRDYRMGLHPVALGELLEARCERSVYWGETEIIHPAAH
jgi:hypothetical protein